MSKIFATSDMHFGHKNIIKYSERPFASLEDMETYMIDTWNRIVGENDVVKVVGDFAMGPPSTDGYIAQKLGLLNGEIHIVLGNHDQPEEQWGQSGMIKIVEDYNLGDKVKVMPDLHSFQVDGVWFDACHYQMKTWPHERRGGVHLYGHYHTLLKKADMVRARRGRFYEVGIDIYGAPVELTGDLRHLNKPKGWRIEK